MQRFLWAKNGVNLECGISNTKEFESKSFCAPKTCTTPPFQGVNFIIILQGVFAPVELRCSYWQTI
jgi:hypothetical protein